MGTIKLTDIPEELLKCLDYSKLHTSSMFNETKHIKSIYLLNHVPGSYGNVSQYRLYLHNNNSAGEYRFECPGSADNIIIDIY